MIGISINGAMAGTGPPVSGVSPTGAYDGSLIGFGVMGPGVAFDGSVVGSEVSIGFWTGTLRGTVGASFVVGDNGAFGAHRGAIDWKRDLAFLAGIGCRFCAVTKIVVLEMSNNNEIKNNNNTIHNRNRNIIVYRNMQAVFRWFEKCDDNRIPPPSL